MDRQTEVASPAPYAVRDTDTSAKGRASSILRAPDFIFTSYYLPELLSAIPHVPLLRIESV